MDSLALTRSTAPPRRLLIVEDDPLLRDRLEKASSRSEGWFVASACDLAGARRMLNESGFDAVFLDLGLPDGDGRSLISACREANPVCEILVITVFADEERVVGSLQAGATGYVLKSDLAEYADRLVSFIETGGSPISPAIARSLIRRLNPPPGRETLAESPLSNREIEVLSLCSRGLRYAEIAEVLGVSSHTVNAHLKNVYRKLMVRSRSEAVFEARRSGLLED